MTAGVSVDISRAVRKLSRIAGQLNTRNLLRLIGQRELNWINKNFRDEGTETPWPTLSPNTIAARRGGGRGAKILRDTGRLAQSFVMEIADREVQVGTASQIAKFHHEGTAPYVIRPRRPGGMLRFMTASGPALARRVNHPGLPRRPLLPSKSVATQLAVDTVERKVDDAIRKGTQ